MALPVKYEVRRFSGGFNNSTSVFGSSVSFPAGGGPMPGLRGGGGTVSLYSPGSVGAHGITDAFSCDPADADSTNCWIRPVSGGVIEAYPAPTEIEDSLSVEVTAAAHGVDSDGSDLTIIYGDGGAKDKIYPINPTASSAAEGATAITTMTNGNGQVASIVSFNDRLCVCNGVDPPIEIDISLGVSDPANASAVINSSPPGVTNASTSLSNVAGNVMGIVKYYCSKMTGSTVPYGTTESALSTSFGEIDVNAGSDTADGGQVTVDISHADFSAETGTNANADATGTNLVDGDAGSSFTSTVEVGMVVMNITDGSTGRVTAITDDNDLTHTALTGGTDNDWDAGDDWIVAWTYRIYRTRDGRDEPHYLTEVLGGRTYTDNVDPDNLGGEPINHGDQPPAGLTDWVAHRGRLFGIAGNDLYWSDPDRHDSWFTSAEGNRLKIHPDDGDTCKALASVPEGLLIFKRNHVYLLQGDDNVGGFHLTSSLASVEGATLGTPHPNSLVSVPGGVVFYWRNGVYAYSRGQFSKISGPVESQWTDPTDAFPKDATISLGYDPRYGHVYVAYEYAANKSSAFIFDINAGQWIGAAQGAAARKYLYWPGSATAAPEFLAIDALTSDANTGDVHQLASDAFDSAADCTEKSRFTPAGAFTGSDPNTLKRWLYLDFFFTTGVATKNVTVTPNIDGTDVASAVTVPLPTVPGRKRVNIGELGYRLTYEFKSSFGSNEKPWGIYEVVAAYQEMPGHSV